jgi:protein TonB
VSAAGLLQPSTQARRRFAVALAVSLAFHAALVASVTPPPPTQPRYVILEARLAVPRAAEGSDYLTSTAFFFPLAPGVRGPVEPQSPTPPKQDAVRAVSDTTLPVDLVETREFAPGFESEPPSLRSPLELPLPETVRWFKASELDALAEPLSPIRFDRLPFLAALGQMALRLRVFIDEAGVVQEIRFEDRPDLAGLEEAVRREFLETRFYPAQKQGRAVKSQKLIELYTQTG